MLSPTTRTNIGSLTGQRRSHWEGQTTSSRKRRIRICKRVRNSTRSGSGQRHANSRTQDWSRRCAWSEHPQRILGGRIYLSSLLGPQADPLCASTSQIGHGNNRGDQVWRSGPGDALHQAELHRRWQLWQGQTVAIKIVEIEGGTDDVREIIEEISILAGLNSPYVTKYFGSYLKGSDLWIIMEFCSGGSCADLLKPGVIAEEYIMIILRELLLGLEYLHSDGKLHRDIKGESLEVGKA
ncbi:hypothetical protein MRB53_037670 [Persea americana]|nr:hypothetical protein MRB53_037670 [Persea americana]